MKITHDKEADAMLIILSDKRATAHKRLNETTLLRLDDKGHLVSIELLDVSEYVADLSKVDFVDITRQYPVAAE